MQLHNAHVISKLKPTVDLLDFHAGQQKVPAERHSKQVPTSVHFCTALYRSHLHMEPAETWQGSCNLNFFTTFK
jgi:hypothetical protein